MSLIKEECLFALESLRPANIYEFKEKGYLPFIEANSILTQLINEHFELVDLLKKHDIENLTIKELDKWFDRSLWNVNKVNELSKYIKSKDEYITGLRNYITQIEREFKDNPPLKFEELHEGMWVWDNNDNKYNKIIEINNDVINFYYVTNSPTRFTCKFEENRFYRYETVEKPEFLKKSMVVKRRKMMMSLDEAIEHCKDKSKDDCKCGEEHKQLSQWLSEYKELKEKATQKKPIMLEMKGFDEEIASHECCPNCKKPIVNVWNTSKYKPRYCHYCGQELDWSDE